MADVQMWLTFAIVAVAIVGFSHNRIPVELTAAAVLVALIAVFILGPQYAGLPVGLELQQILAGFANPALVSVLALIIVGQALFLTRALERTSQRLARTTRLTPWVTIGLTFVGAAVLSAFLNNTPVVVMLIPILGGLARVRRIPAAKVLMAMNFATILGGTTTLIGSSTNLLVADIAMRNSDVRLNLFDITVPGVVLAASGLVYVLLFVPRLFADRDGGVTGGASGKQFISEIVLPEEHPLVGTRATAGLFPGLRHVTVRLLQRGGTRHLAPYEDIGFEPGDRIVFGGTRDELLDLGILSSPRPDDARPDPRPTRGRSLAEAIVAPGSRIVGRSPQETGIERDPGLRVAAVERRGRMPRGTLADKRLEVGDVLLVAGSDEALDRLRGSRDLIILERSIANLPARADANKAVAVFVVMVLAIALGIVDIPVAALAAAFAVLALGCLNVRQARRAFDGRIFMLVGAAIATATALQATGGAAYLAELLVRATAGAGPAVLLSAMFALIAVMTNLLSNNATAVLFTPVAISAANAVGAPVEPFVVAVIFAANASFATPVGYQTNLIVMGPGGYRFGDFLLAGGPLVILLWGVFSVFAPWYYGF